MDYQSNSNKSKKEPDNLPEKQDAKVVEKVVTGTVATKPKPLSSKFKSVFLGQDVKGVFQYIVAEVLFPAARNAIVDATSKGIERAVYGDSGPRGRRPSYGPRTTYTSYNSPVSRRDPRDEYYEPRRRPSHGRPSGRDIILSSRDDAELVVERLIDIISKYDVACLADLHELIGLRSSHTDQKWGWTYLSDVEIRQVREGWLIDLPDVEPI